MKIINNTKFVLLALASALFSVPAIQAQTLVFNVDINTTGLSAASADAPFYLDFTMAYGNSSLASNTATLSNFSFTGGSAVGSAVTSGAASGSFASTVALTASSANPMSELYQQFDASVTDIRFQVSITEVGPNPQGTPSEFTASILDSSLGFPAQIFTNAPDTASLVTLDLSASNTGSSVNYYAGVSSADGVTGLSSVAAVPEPSTTAAILGCAGVIVAAGVRRFARKQAA